MPSAPLDRLAADPRRQGSIFSVISVGELLAPTLGGIINKFSYYGVYALGAGVLVVDIVVRLLVLEKSVARRYGLVDPRPPSPSPTPRSSDDDPIDERTPLTARRSTASSLPMADPSRSTNPLVRAFPFVRAMANPRLLASFFVAFNQAALLAAFDATIPTHAQAIFDFDSLKAGALFAALDLPYLICGPVMGWLVDRRGPRLMATIGGIYLVPTLVLLRIPHRVGTGEDQTVQVAVYSVLLGLNGIGMSILSSPSLVDASAVVEDEGKEHPERYGGKAPFGQLYAVYSAVFSLGLSVGPILAGMLSDAAGYGNSMLVMAVLAGATAAVSFLFLGKR